MRAHPLRRKLSRTLGGLAFGRSGSMMGLSGARDRRALRLALLLTTYGTRHKILYENTAELIVRPNHVSFPGAVS